MARDPLQDVVNNLEKSLEEAVTSGGVLAEEYRVELLWIGIPVAIWCAIMLLLHRTPMTAGIYTMALAMAVLAIPAVRYRMGDALVKSKLRRNWHRAVTHAGFRQSVRLDKFEKVATGWRARIRVGKGIAVKDLEMRREHIAASMGIRELRLKRDEHNAQTGTVTFIMDIMPVVRMPEGKGKTKEGPPRARAYRPDRIPRPRERYANHTPVEPEPTESIWEPIQVGVDEHDLPVSVSLAERNLLLGGVPGSGKSVAMSHILGSIALDPSVNIWLIDWKSVEFLEFESCAMKIARTPGEAIELCQDLWDAMEQNYAELRKLGKKKIMPELSIPIHCLFVDELAPYTDGSDRKQNAEFSSLLIDLVGRGRASGVINVVSTQKPDATTVPTKLRDLFAYRWAMRCMTPEASDTILGRGWAARGYSAVDISDDQPGVGYLLSDEKLPRRHRSFNVQEDEIRSLAERAKRGRGR